MSGVTKGCWNRLDDAPGKGRFTPDYDPWFRYWGRTSAPAELEDGVVYEIVDGERRRVGTLIPPR